MKTIFVILVLGKQNKNKTYLMKVNFEIRKKLCKALLYVINCENIKFQINSKIDIDSETTKMYRPYRIAEFFAT
jgi:hypothetical protein